MTDLQRLMKDHLDGVLQFINLACPHGSNKTSPKMGERERLRSPIKEVAEIRTSMSPVGAYNAAIKILATCIRGCRIQLNGMSLYKLQSILLTLPYNYIA